MLLCSLWLNVGAGMWGFAWKSGSFPFVKGLAAGQTYSSRNKNFTIVLF
jgi:hypothetical protein